MRSNPVLEKRFALQVVRAAWGNGLAARAEVEAAAQSYRAALKAWRRETGRRVPIPSVTRLLRVIL